MRNFNCNIEEPEYDGMRGDLRPAYLAWLLAVQAGDVDGDAKEPPVGGADFASRENRTNVSNDWPFAGNSTAPPLSVQHCHQVALESVVTTNVFYNDGESFHVAARLEQTMDLTELMDRLFVCPLVGDGKC